MLSSPKITVLMPVYNCELYIQEAVDSVLNQTFTDFEFLIIDDASTDATVAIIKKYNDPRIQLIQKPENSGYTNSLNHGLSIAKGEYIARMDGDDISLPERFAKQVAFLDANQDVVLCGTFYSIIGTEKGITVPENFEDIKLALLRKCCFGHPTVMIRKKSLDKLVVIYDVSKEPAEDYDLWIRLLAIGKLHNLQEVLLNYRVHDSQVSQKRDKQQINSALEARLNILQYLDCTIEASERELLKKVILNSDDTSFDEIKQFLFLNDKLKLSNSNSFFETKGFQDYLCSLEEKTFRKYFLNRNRYSPMVYLDYLRIKKKWKLISREELKLAVKALIFYKNK
ncbi:glycosyltransferase [Flavobacterium sp. ZT3R18]|uniref:glycosyltransferase family 2 protein n=1 Tax=Flavobacterium sp. ZT3R18 TaxID=2594429 RepID=UPI00117B1CB9|nr:glycosyltransferase [Flavobacterium sp. ZT3R18]TRX34835.1 glycosyltransferase [Flavobacterium sp. ZT3R18]